MYKRQIYSYLRSFGQDGKNNFMEINDLASALSKYHFDFILFDACYMSCAEVAYAFRECADYIIGSPTEILANGFPYQSIMGDMFKKEADEMCIRDRSNSMTGLLVRLRFTVRIALKNVLSPRTQVTIWLSGHT